MYCVRGRTCRVRNANSTQHTSQFPIATSVVMQRPVSLLGFLAELFAGLLRFLFFDDIPGSKGGSNAHTFRYQTFLRFKNTTRLHTTMAWHVHFKNVWPTDLIEQSLRSSLANNSFNIPLDINYYVLIEKQIKLPKRVLPRVLNWPHNFKGNPPTRCFLSPQKNNPSTLLGLEIMEELSFSIVWQLPYSLSSFSSKAK